MHRTRHILAASLAAVALGAVGCGDDEEDTRGNDDSVVETQTPAQPEQTTPAPAGSDPETRTDRADGE